MLKEAIITPILTYLSNNSAWKTLANGLVLILVAFCLSIMILMVNNFSGFMQIVDKINTTDNIKIKNIEKELEKSIRINVALEEVLQDIPLSARAFIFKFHNGIRGPNGVSFTYQSNTHEVAAPGYASQLSELQNINLTINPALLQALISNDCYMYTVDGTQKQFAAYSKLLRQYGVVSTSICPLKDKDNILVGYIGVNYNVKISDEKLRANFKILGVYAERLASLMSP